MEVSEVEWGWIMETEDAAQRRPRVNISHEERCKVKFISLYNRSLFTSYPSTEILTPPAPR